jgi:hypothetical protein
VRALPLLGHSHAGFVIVMRSCLFLCDVDRRKTLSMGFSLFVCLRMPRW